MLYIYHSVHWKYSKTFFWSAWAISYRERVNPPSGRWACSLASVSLAFRALWLLLSVSMFRLIMSWLSSAGLSFFCFLILRYDFFKSLLHLCLLPGISFVLILSLYWFWGWGQMVNISLYLLFLKFYVNLVRTY